MSTAADSASDPSTSRAFPGGFTVLMSVYLRDDPATFERAVESVFRNTVQPDDFVLVVDGPTGNDLDEAIRRCTAKHPVRTFRLDRNLGLARALNAGLALVRTAWVVRADADDLNVPYRFERQAEAIRRVANEVDLIGGAILEVDKVGTPLAIRTVPLEHQRIVSRLATRNPFNHMTVAYRAELVREVGGYPDIHLKEDYGLWATLVARGARCANVEDILVEATTGVDMYRRRGGVRLARSEWALQRHLLQTGRTGPARALAVGLLRAAASLVPTAVRKWVYETLLRRPPEAARRAPGSADTAGRR